jgi:hypothetical protein
VPLARPQDAAVVTGARIFTELGPRRRGRPGAPRACAHGADSAMMAQMAAAARATATT